MLTLSPRATHRPRSATRSTTSSSSRHRTGRPRCAQRHTHLKNLDVKQCALTTHHCSPGPVCRSACPSSRSRALSWSGTSAPRPIAAPLPPTHDRCVARPLTLAPNARGAQGSLRRPSYAARAVRGRVAYADFAPQEAPRSRRASVRTRSKRHPVQPTVARHNTRALTTNLAVAQWSGSDHRVGFLRHRCRSPVRIRVLESLPAIARTRLTLTRRSCLLRHFADQLTSIRYCVQEVSVAPGCLGSTAPHTHPCTRNLSPPHCTCADLQL